MLKRSVKYSNFLGEAIDAAVEFGAKGILLVGHIGKLVKLAAGIMNTHSRNADARMDILKMCIRDRELRERCQDIRSLAGVKFAVIGAGTREALEAAGIYADFVPSRYSSADLAAEWIPTLEKEDKLLLLRAEEASTELTEALETAGIDYKAVALYRTERDGRKAEELNRLLPEMDYITFASASAVKAFAAMAEQPKMCIRDSI